MTLRWKLIALYVAILCLVIGGFSVALTVGVRQSLVESMDRELEARGRAVVSLAEVEHGKWFVEDKTGLKSEYGPGRGLTYVIADRDGKIVLASDPGLTMPPSDGGREAGGYREFAASTQKLVDPDEGDKPIAVRVMCGKSMAAIDASMATLTGRLWAIGPAALLLSIVGGFFLVSRALRPIDRMASAAEQINATDLSKRIDVSGGDELARLAATLNAMFERLQESFDRQTRFTADASHELRTPLSVIAGNVELALKRPRTAEEYRELIGDIGEATDRMRAIVESLLTLARADAKAVQIRQEPVSLTTLADEMARLHRPLGEKQGVTISVESEGDVSVKGDPERLKELVANLMSNAIRYNKPGGRVSVRVSSQAGRAQLTVDDTGIGIPAEDLPRIFERFYRVDKARSREMGGSGLGLAIVKWIVEAHQGTISVDSRVGEGSRFVVSLPA